MKTEIFDKAIKIAGTQKILARKAGLSQGAISKYKRGVAIPRGWAAKRLSDAVGGEITPQQFMFID